VKKHLRTFNLIGGGMLVVIGIMLMTGLWNAFNSWLQVVIGGYTVIL
jgi:cytochrome c-type biogenesis protein